MFVSGDAQSAVSWSGRRPQCSHIVPPAERRPDLLQNEAVIGFLRRAGSFAAVSAAALGQGERMGISASTLFDGQGHVLRDQRIVIAGSRIVEISPQAGHSDYDLRGLTVLPGWIDAHVHITWSFGFDGQNMNQGGA